ncbi:MAG: hypothetical protein WBM07_08920 [Chitinivibrionales bacterium]
MNEKSLRRLFLTTIVVLNKWSNLSRYLKKSMEVSVIFNGIKLQVVIFVLLFVGAGYCDSQNCHVYNTQTIPWNKGLEVIATVVIDSIVNNKITFSVLSISQIDTSIYYSTPIPNPFDTNSHVISYDTSGFPRHHIDSLITINSLYNPSIGQQFNNVFILQISAQNGNQYWWISETKDCFLTEIPSNFSLNNAISYLNTFINQTSILKGNSPPKNGILKLGPIFRDVEAGDPSWKLSAYNDSSYWYFNQYAGYGDCPLGCTEGFNNFYRVSKDGTVKLDSIQCIPPAYCIENIIITNKSIDRINNNIGFGSSKIYSISGRYIAKIPSDQMLNFNSCMIKLGLKQGVYLVKNENGGVIRLIRFEKNR